jgi:hypothetical protein
MATFQQNPTGGVNEEYPWDHHQIKQGLRRNPKPFYFSIKKRFQPPAADLVVSNTNPPSEAIGSF